MDMRASQGWMLVARDFGTPTNAPTRPWIILYNRFRGIMRVCVLRTSELLTTYQNLEVSFDNSTVSPQLFRFTEETSQSGNTKSGSLQWMVAEYNLQAYDPNIAQQARFRFNLSEVASTNIALNGGLNIDGIAQPLPSKKSAVGSGASKVYEVTTHASKLWDKIQETGKDGFKGVVAAVSKNPIAITNAAAGLIKSLTGSGGTPSYSIALQGTVSLTGTMALNTPAGSFEVYLRDNANNSGQPKALQSIPWGVMNYNSAVPVTARVSIEDRSSNCLISTSSGFFNNILSLNPNISSNITSIEAAWIFIGQSSAQFVPLSTFQQTMLSRYYTFSSRTGANGYGTAFGPNAVGIRITYSNGDVVFNKFPIAYTRICC